MLVEVTVEKMVGRFFCPTTSSPLPFLNRVDRFPNKLAPNVLNKMLKNPSFYFFVSFITFLLKLFSRFFKRFNCFRNVIHLSIWNFFNAVIPDPKIVFWIVASCADTAVVNPKSIRTLLVRGLRTFFIKGKPVLSNGPRSLPKSARTFTTPGSWVFHKFMLGDELFTKTVRSLETCLSVNDNLCGKSVPSSVLPITFDERVTWVPFFILDFHLLSY